MDPRVFAAGVSVASAPTVSTPPAAKAKPTPLDIEMSDVQRPPSKDAYDIYDFATSPAGVQTPAEARTQPPTGTQTPLTPDELESNSFKDDRPTQNMTGVTPSFWYPSMNRWRVLSACITYFGNGMNDSAAGPLIPYMESDYRIGYAVVSLIFVTNAAGFILMAFAVDSISEKLGRARSLMLSEAIVIVGYVMIICTPPFGVVIVGYLFLGLGIALNLALNNVFGANLADSTVMLGLMHGSYGVGGIVAPVVATAMVSKGIIWSRFFIIILGTRVVNLFFTGWANKGYETEETSKFSAVLEQVASRQRAEDGAPTKLQLLKRALKNKTTIIGALFIFAYQGAEVAISGWVISYLIAARNGDPNQVGYVTSGFWGGITLGRFGITPFAKRIGEKRLVYGLMVGVIAFQLLVWLIPNIIADSVSVSIVGLLLGPVYACGQTIFVQLLPSNIQTTSISFISSAGSSGGAVFPLMVGLLAQAVGTFVLHPIAIALFVLQIGCWFALPKVVKRHV